MEKSEFTKELKELLKKHDVTKFSFCCEIEGKFKGVVNVDNDGLTNLGHFYESGLMIARFYGITKQNIINSITQMEEK